MRLFLQSVSLLTDSLLLLATVAKMTTSVSDLVVETTLSLFNHCLERLVQVSAYHLTSAMHVDIRESASPHGIII